ncbi:MAG TPA: metalloregulator ArsR/SmtB family transcription factor [Longimicrobiales bacterium]|nr:metalloregulator ArsR/SmtB family transcription factor [Longimicrobiales bacterium]
MDAALKAISEPNRRRILELVTAEELTAGEIAAHFEVTRPAVSQHLTVLKQAGLVSERRQGTRRLYRTRRQGFAGARLYLERFWDDYLERLRREGERGGGTKVTDERLAVQREMLIAAPPRTVWDLLTNPARTTHWMGRAADFDLSPGGGYRLEVVPGQTAVGEFIEIEPPARLAFTWGWEGDAGGVVPPGSTIVVFELLPNHGGTLLRLTHRDLPGIASAGSHSRGWGHFLERLAVAASGGSPGPDPWVTDPDRLLAELRPSAQVRAPREGET